MSERINRSVVSSPEPPQEDLSALAGRWNVGVQVTLTNPARLRPAPSKSFGRRPPRRPPAPSGHEDPADRVGGA